MLPKFKDYFYPFLAVLKDGEAYPIAKIRDDISTFLNLTQEDLDEKTKGGRSKHSDRVKWAITYLKGVNLIISPSRCKYKITAKGLEYLNKYGDKFSLDIIRDIEEYKKISRTTNARNSHWVKGHYRYDGTYIPGYYSNSIAKGIRKTKATLSFPLEITENNNQ